MEVRNEVATKRKAPAGEQGAGLGSVKRNILLPINRGDKRPSGKQMEGWQTFTIERMNQPEYLARLNHGANIGVLLGNGRVTIDLDRDENVEPFLKLNPKLRGTLRSRRKRGCNLWVRIRGEYPKSCKLKTSNGEDWGEWRADRNKLSFTAKP
jgi:bifunctional DNA primase/polymerase-like protein